MGQPLRPSLIPSRTTLSTASSILTFPLSSSLLIVLGVVFLIWYAKYLWGRRHLYYHAYKTPGPFALPIFGNAFNFISRASDIPKTICEITERYDGIWTLWLGSKLFFVLSDVKYLQIILTHPSALNKDDGYRFLQVVTGESIFSTFSITRWKSHRKLIAPSFSQKILENFFKIFVEQSEICCEVVKENAGKGVFKLFNAIEKCTLDIITETAMGLKTEYQTTDVPSDFCHYVNKGFTIATVRIFNVFWQPDIIFNNIRVGKVFKKAVLVCRTFVQKVVQEKRAEFEKSLKDSKHDFDGKKGKKTAFLDSLLETIHQENERWSEKELIDEVSLFMIAGYDTTATALASTLMALGMHSEIQDKLYQEVLEQVGPQRRLVYSDIAKLKYCERVIKETLRLFSSVFIGRYVSEDIELDGNYIIPKGSSVIANLKSASRNPKYWKDPLKFDPDRFLPENLDSADTFFAFSIGPRNCIGKRYAMLEMITFLATFILKYKTHSEYKCVAEVEMKMSGVLKPVHGFKTSIELRNP